MNSFVMVSSSNGMEFSVRINILEIKAGFIEKIA
jgi:hypothetical protein